MDRSLTFNVVDYGARTYGATTDAFQDAIDAAAERGSGIVVVPPGEFTVGTVALRSNVTLHLEAGAVVRGSTKQRDYSKACIIYADDVHNAAVTGRGTIDGQGRSFYRKGPGEPLPDFRPRAFLLKNCRNLTLEDFTLRDTAMWAIHPVDCDRVLIRGLTLLNGNYEWGGRNADGIDVDGCSNVRISDCYLETGDDAVVLKCTRQSHSGACRNVTVTNCVIRSDETALKIGSETNGEFTGITFANCAVRDSGNGIGLWVRDGGLVDGWTVSNISINVSPGFRRGGQTLYFWAYPREEGSRCGAVRNVIVSNVTSTGDGGIFISGFHEQHIEDILLQNVRVHMRGAQERPHHAEPPYPFEVWGHQRAPHDVFCRYVDRLELQGVHLTRASPEKPAWGSALRCRHINDLLVDGFRGRQSVGSNRPAIALTDVHDVMIRNCRAVHGTTTFLTLDDATTRVALMNNDLLSAETAFTTPPGRGDQVFTSGNRLE